MHKPKLRVILAALAAILLLAFSVCALHAVNAVSLKGTQPVGAYTLTDGAAENWAALTDDPWQDGGVIHVTGALMRMNQPVGAVNVRAGLIAEGSDEVILLNTQMVRRPDLAQRYGCDDHCGYAAAVKADDLTRDTQYRIVLTDETDGQLRMLDAGVTIVPAEGGLASARRNAPEEGERHAQ